MGKVIYLNKLREFFSNTPVFTSRDVRTAVGAGSYGRLMLHNLVKKGEIQRLVRGYYTKLDDPIVSVFCFRPAYLGLHTALSIHKLWGQETNITIITAKKVRVGVRTVLGSNVNIHRVDSRYLFGFDLLKYENVSLPVSDIEKTLLDFLYFGIKLDKEAVKGISERIDHRKLRTYASRFPREIAEKASKFLT